MAKQQIESLIGTCECGCGDEITPEYEYIEWSNMLFSDRSHVIEYLKLTDDLKEVG